MAETVERPVKRKLDLLTTEEAAEIVKRTPDTLKYWRYKRKGPPYRDIYGRPMYDRAELYEWLASQPRRAHEVAPR
jgi:hypothetical protein